MMVGTWWLAATLFMSLASASTNSGTSLSSSARFCSTSAPAASAELACSLFFRGGSSCSSSSSSSSGRPEISPSLLAADWSDVRGEVRRCVEEAGARRIHLDVFDGAFLDSPRALTFGPKMVAAVRRRCDEILPESAGDERVCLDVHLCVDRPARYVETMAEAGATRFVFQLEALDSPQEAEDLVRAVRKAGMRCGVSLNPSTPVRDARGLLDDENGVDSVNVLAVEPGFGGQAFQSSAIQKIRELKAFREERAIFKGVPMNTLEIAVDGGINEQTAPLALEAGADVLVAGTFLFRHPQGLKAGADALLRKKSEPYTSNMNDTFL